MTAQAEATRAKELAGLIERVCSVCGKPIPHRAGEYPWQYRRRKFCSRSCGTIARNKRYEEPVSRRLTWSMAVDEATGCWNWTGPLKPDGYGRITIAGAADTVHRAAYRTWCGPIPDGMSVCHRCDNRRCMNPLHLFLGTNAENTADRDQKGRQARGESSGRAKLTDDDVRSIRMASGTYRSIAARFGVGESTVSRIRSRSGWAHVKD
jgi:hypothetical protein